MRVYNRDRAKEALHSDPKRDASARCPGPEPAARARRGATTSIPSDFLFFICNFTFLMYKKDTYSSIYFIHPFRFE